MGFRDILTVGTKQKNSQPVNALTWSSYGRFKRSWMYLRCIGGHPILESCNAVLLQVSQRRHIDWGHLRGQNRVQEGQRRRRNVLAELLRQAIREKKCRRSPDFAVEQGNGGRRHRKPRRGRQFIAVFDGKPAAGSWRSDRRGRRSNPRIERNYSLNMFNISFKCPLKRGLLSDGRYYVYILYTYYKYSELF